MRNARHVRASRLQASSAQVKTYSARSRPGVGAYACSRNSSSRPQAEHAGHAGGDSSQAGQAGAPPTFVVQWSSGAPAAT